MTTFFDDSKTLKEGDVDVDRADKQDVEQINNINFIKNKIIEWIATKQSTLKKYLKTKAKL